MLSSLRPSTKLAAVGDRLMERISAMVTSQIVEPEGPCGSAKQTRPARRFIEKSIQVACSSLCLRLADSVCRTRCCRIDRLLLFHVRRRSVFVRLIGPLEAVATKL